MKKSRRFGNINKYIELFQKMTIEEKNLMIDYLKDEKKYEKEINELFNKVKNRPIQQFTYTYKPLFRFKKSKKNKKSIKFTKSKKVGNTIVKYTKSNKKSKKWMTRRPDGKMVYWGHPKMEDYTQHHDKERRRRFRKRMGGIRLKDGSKAISKKYSSAWLSYYVTW